MQRIQVNSSTIDSIGYDYTILSLEIEFINGGIYQYSGVPSNVFDALMTSNSHGKYFINHIKDVYPVKQIS